MDAEHSGLALLTTEKDRARMAGERLLEALFTRAHALPVTMVLTKPMKCAGSMTTRLRS